MKPTSYPVFDNKYNLFWRAEAPDFQATSRQRGKAEQLAKDLKEAWNATEPTNIFNERR